MSITSYCTHCFDGNCRQHPNQDHGRSKTDLKLKSSESLKKSYNDLIQSQINRLILENRGTSEQEINEYKEQIEYERELAMKKKRKKISKEYERLALTTGLSGAVLSAMIDSDSENEIKDKKRKKKSSKTVHDQEEGEEEEEEETERKMKKKSKKNKKKKDKKSKKSKRKKDNSSSSCDSSSAEDES